MSVVEPIRWREDALELLDQRALPQTETWLRCDSVAATAQAIRDMVVRGAPAIGITAAYGAVLSARACYARDGAGWRRGYDTDLDMLREARPTAVNLAWAVDAMRACVVSDAGDPVPPLLRQARALHRADVDNNRLMGDAGAALIAPGAGVLTHCNAGALATAGYGTALGVIRSAWRDGRVAAVYAGETRPWLQGARLTAWELLRDGIDVTLITDSAAAQLMRSGAIQWVITGADRVAANGDTANKIGTYALATLARAHDVRFMVAAPLSTIDRAAADGDSIPIEYRADEEITHLAGTPIAAPGAAVLNPVFDVTPATLIDVLVTEKGAIRRPNAARISALFKD